MTIFLFFLCKWDLFRLAFFLFFFLLFRFLLCCLTIRAGIHIRNLTIPALAVLALGLRVKANEYVPIPHTSTVHYWHEFQLSYWSAKISDISCAFTFIYKNGHYVQFKRICTRTWFDLPLGILSKSLPVALTSKQRSETEIQIALCWLRKYSSPCLMHSLYTFKWTCISHPNSILNHVDADWSVSLDVVVFLFVTRVEVGNVAGQVGKLVGHQWSGCAWEYEIWGC